MKVEIVRFPEVLGAVRYNLHLQIATKVDVLPSEDESYLQEQS